MSESERPGGRGRGRAWHGTVGGEGDGRKGHRSSEGVCGRLLRQLAGRNILHGSGGGGGQPRVAHVAATRSPAPTASGAIRRALAGFGQPCLSRVVATCWTRKDPAWVRVRDTSLKRHEPDAPCAQAIATHQRSSGYKNRPRQVESRQKKKEKEQAKPGSLCGLPGDGTRLCSRACPPWSKQHRTRQ